MCAHQISAVRVHGGLLQKERYEAIEAFRKGHYRFLIASDVAGRGLDIADVQLVVQYELSDDLRKYIHRIGRSARLDQAGESLVLLSDQQQNIWEAILPTLTKQPQLLSAAHYLREINGAALSAPDTKKQKKVNWCEMMSLRYICTAERIKRSALAILSVFSVKSSAAGGRYRRD